MAKTIRTAYGEALVKYGAENPDVVVLDADVSASTQTCMFHDRFPDRFFNLGIAESNMTAMAAGFASVGKIPFVNTFAVFLTTMGLISARAFGSYSKLPIKLAGAYGGISDMFDGPSHHSTEDLAIMRSLPNFKVFVPCDVVQTDWVVRNAIADLSPMYIRLSREAFPSIYEQGKSFTEGKAEVIREGRDVTIIAAGLMVGNALEAAAELSREGIEARVVDMFCIKPLDKTLVIECAKYTGAIVVAEEHNIIGGLGGAVAETLCEAGVHALTGFAGLCDTHTECGNYTELQRKYGLDAAAIIGNVKQLLKTRRQ